VGIGLDLLIPISDIRYFIVSIAIRRSAVLVRVVVFVLRYVVGPLIIPQRYDLYFTPPNDYYLYVLKKYMISYF
jgi:hypothetical protein